MKFINLLLVGIVISQANGTITEEEESQCIDEVFSNKQSREVERLQNKLSTVFREFPNIFREDGINLPSYKRKCKRLGHSLVSFQVKITRDIEKCFREQTKKEYQAFEALSRDLIQFVCNFKEKQIRALINEKTKTCFLMTFDKITNCIKLAADADEEGNYSFFENFCDFNSTEMLTCSKNAITKCNIDSEIEGPVLIIESLLIFMDKKHKCRSLRPANSN